MQRECYKVNEIFDSLQGEGFRAGWPSTFIRLQGCPVGCAWCDTKYTWSDGIAASWDQIAAKTAEQSDDRCALLDADTLMVRLLERKTRHVVLTGGEPAIYDLMPLTDRLHRCGIRSQVETSGTRPLSVHAATWVTCSPKIAMPGGLHLNRAVVHRADEIKMPVGKPRDVELLRTQVLPFARADVPVYLQPLSCSTKATALCQEQARAHGWAVSIQLHKFLGLR